MDKHLYRKNKHSINIYWNYHIAIVAGVFLVGVCLMTLAGDKEKGWWRLIHEVGTFVAAVVATHLIHELLIKKHDYNYLLRMLEEVYTTNAIKYDINSGIIETSRNMDLTAFIENITQAHQRIWILRTWFPELELMEFSPKIEAAVKRKLDISILIMHPNSLNAPARGRELGMQKPYSAKEAILDNLKIFKQISEHLEYPSNLQIRLYWGTATMSILGQDEEAFVGLYWREHNAMKSPQLRVAIDENSRYYFGKFVSGHFQSIWSKERTIDFGDPKWMEIILTTEG